MSFIPPQFFTPILPLVSAILVLVYPLARSQESEGPFRTQKIVLTSGWNAVFIEVEPVDSSPDAVFASLPIDKVATLFQRPNSQQFVTDPSVDITASSGWAVWYAPGSPAAFLKSLDAVPGDQAYLVHTTRNCTLSIRGKVKPLATNWQPNAFNLVGFPVRTPGGPTFRQFFEGSKAHRNQDIYRLIDGKWKKLLNASSEAMRSGESFWIFCDKASAYQGPLSVETENLGGLILGTGDSRVVLRNSSPFPLTPVIEHLVSEGPSVPLSIMIRSFGDPNSPVRAVPAEMPPGAWTQALPPLEISGSIAIPFESRHGAMSRPRQSSLLKITTDLGTETWLPVISFRKDLNE